MIDFRAVNFTILTQFMIYVAFMNILNPIINAIGSFTVGLFIARDIIERVYFD